MQQQIFWQVAVKASKMAVVWFLRECGRECLSGPGNTVSIICMCICIVFFPVLCTMYFCTVQYYAKCISRSKKNLIEIQNLSNVSQILNSGMALEYFTVSVFVFQLLVMSYTA
jgi:hypothetical protein